MKARIHIKNLRLRAIIGIYDWEREHKQDVIISVEIVFNAKKSSQTDKLKDTIDYKVITKKIIKEVEASSFYLIEKLAKHILDIVLENPKVLEVTVKVDKPHALRFADSVSIELTQKR